MPSSSGSLSRRNSSLITIKSKNKGAAKKTSCSATRIITLLVVIVATTQILFVLKYDKQQKSNNNNLPHHNQNTAAGSDDRNAPQPHRVHKRRKRRTDISSASSSSAAPNHQIDYTMWSKDESYTRDCELHIKGNETWGKSHAPYVDKVAAKRIIQRMNIQDLKIIPTLAILDKTDMEKGRYTLEYMMSLKQPYIIKASHMSGGIARVFNNKYHCFKYCKNQKIMPLGPLALNASKYQLTSDLSEDYSKMGSEMQYKYIPPAIIIEEDVISSGKTSTDVTYWWVSNGHPVFVSEQCKQSTGLGTQMNRVFLGTDYQRLPILFNRGTCDTLPPKPKSWDKQLQIMKELGKGFPGEVVRVDVYGGSEEVWFSELTFTTTGCWKRFKPWATDGLLYGLMKNKISPTDVNSASIIEYLNDTSWVTISLDFKTLSSSHPSPVDACLMFEEYVQVPAARMKKELFDSCISALNKTRGFPLHCIVSNNNGTFVKSFGVKESSVVSASNVEICEAMYHKMKLKKNVGVG